jgi:hypothetical protein
MAVQHNLMADVSRFVMFLSLSSNNSSELYQIHSESLFEILKRKQ